MIIVTMQQLNKYHAANLVLDGISLQIQEGGKYGLIGQNGSGKSTLLRLIAGHEQADGGMLAIRKGLQIGYLPQIPSAFDKLTVYETLAYGCRDLLAIKREMTLLEERLSSSGEAGEGEALERLLRSYASAQERFERGGGYEMDVRIDQVASGLQIDRGNDHRPFTSLSGGEKTRIVLASQLITRPELLLLDEPTNHLDLKGLEWLEQYLSRYEGTCIIVSHDRYFLDAATDRTIELEDGGAQLYPVSYSGYVIEKEQLLLQQFAQYQEQQKLLKKMKESIRQLEEWGRVGGNEKFFKRAASIRRSLEKMETVKRPQLNRKTANFELSPLDRSARIVIAFEDIRKSFGERALLKGAEGRLFYGERVVLLGENGSGKSTLFKLIQGMEVPDEGSVTLGSRVEIGYLAQQESVSDSKQTLLDYFRTEGKYEEGEARNVLAGYLFYGNDVFKPLSALSGGEWSRLRLALIVSRNPNLLLLDEPTNHLDIDSREALEKALDDFPGTVLAISHDRYFINRLAERVWELNAGQVSSYLGNYDAYSEQRGREAARIAESVPSLPSLPSMNATADKGRRSSGIGSTGVKSDKGNDRSLSQLELEIASLEAKLAQSDEALNAMAGETDSVLLEEEWRKREALASSLDQRMEEWLALSGE
ncbi:ABC-F family ATP-binding cassette domain-containing protein [Paenibacillus radicis (ex Gao et al. 2016)]|uniref:ABC transporter ATP-binding protein n=1 Tax=Paenibacillus radicis (ex Gao et al. 2016) TaxID=1737354 RepID=A0A917GQF4_9BACL|nr:ABC-F family ATP-binding cassette domain-containing protein [Paenibacillus radicis (ex Gao et al. 2016)]GGG54336.1 ABC transporter ATP-binding protein [Paenibacillus radicis (ex Gao et al. 2016)]